MIHLLLALLPALQPGASCTAPTAEHSLSIDTTIGAYERLSGADARHMKALSAKDANVIYVRSKGFAPVAWIYKDELGTFWIARARSVQWNSELKARVQRTFGVVPPATFETVFVPHPPKRLDSYFRAMQCFQGGSAFFAAGSTWHRNHRTVFRNE